MMSRTTSMGWSWKTPTVVTPSGTSPTIRATVGGSARLRLQGAKTKPNASAPHSTALSASSRLVRPQILTLAMTDFDRAAALSQTSTRVFQGLAPALAQVASARLLGPVPSPGPLPRGRPGHREGRGPVSYTHL